ncbi:hypothetical protein GCM10025865_02670 [Paraoerskovia sediminicola]|uniref:MobA-like NTP transferase domain-containing protein n=1 Tax=Paraoerskovia sediminicola TaxID=1138587 RepID=A0ABM8FYY2_9CELL|nr:nucleotidyltransferase family protein [Paraoerskovia sediminicola]BDZ40968.1 hypothetical protein GCM10025865_02670 [Paraoerskovia sediminicola]
MHGSLDDSADGSMLGSNGSPDGSRNGDPESGQDSGRESCPVDLVQGVILAAGAGRRYGGPKALARSADGRPWLERACSTLRAGGVADLLVVLGAGADEARRLVPRGVDIVVAADWAHGVSASLRAALAVSERGPADAVVVTLVDLPGLTAAAVTRVLERAAAGSPRLTAALARATYDGVPGHPVVVGREHWGALDAALDGDVGAGPYLTERSALAVECGDLGGGADVDER